MPQRHPIDPKVDCVFKALLGSPANTPLLIHFLNAILSQDLDSPITLGAPTSSSALFMPTRTSALPGWTDLHSAQLKEGQDYNTLKATYSIWLLGEPLWSQRDQAVHRFAVRDDHGQRLVPYGSIWVIELSKLQITEVHSEQDRWLKFFIEGEQLSQARRLPEWMHTQEMQQAMQTIKQFSEKQKAYLAYQARQNYLRQERTQQHYLEEYQRQAEYERAEKERERAEKEHERAEKERAQAAFEQERTEKEQERSLAKQAQAAMEQERAKQQRLADKLRRLGIDPDADD